MLGPSKNEGNEMAQWVLTSKETVVPRRSCCRSTAQEMASDVEKKKQEAFTTIITANLGDSMSLPTPPVDQLLALFQHGTVAQLLRDLSVLIGLF